MNSLRIALIAVVLQTGASPQTPGATVEGVVIDQSTGQPIAGAIVEMTGIATPQSGAPDWRVRSFSTVTDANGKFLLTGVPPGTAYQLVATRAPDFVPGVHGQSHPDDSWVPIVLSAGQQVVGRRISLVPLSSISGRVVNQEGKPQKNERVMALGVRYRDGHRVLDSAGFTFTDSQGHYRIGGLPPGYYVIRIRPQARVSNRVFTGAPHSIYFPDTKDPNESAEILLRRAANVEGMNLIMIETRLRRVQGVLRDADTGSAVQNARVFLVPARASPDSSMTREFVSDNGHFDFREVAPGDYTLFGVADRGLPFSGRLPIRIEGLDLQAVQLTLRRDVDLEGVITVDDPVLSSSLDFSRSTVTVSPRSLATVDVSHYAGVMAEGRTPALSRGKARRSFRVSSGISSWRFCKSLFFGSRPVAAHVRHGRAWYLQPAGVGRAEPCALWGLARYRWILPAARAGIISGLSGRSATPGNVPCGEAGDGRPRAALCRTRTARVPRMWRVGVRLPSPGVRVVQAGEAFTVLVQRPRGVSVLLRPEDGRHRRASGRPCVSPRSGPAVGTLAVQPKK